MNWSTEEKEIRRQWAIEALSLLNSYTPSKLERYTIRCGEDGIDILEIIVYPPDVPIETKYGQLTTGYIVNQYHRNYLPIGFVYTECTLPREIVNEVCGFGKVGFGILFGEWVGNLFESVPDHQKRKFGKFIID